MRKLSIAHEDRTMESGKGKGRPEHQRQTEQFYLGLNHFGAHFYSFKLADSLKDSAVQCNTRVGQSEHSQLEGWTQHLLGHLQAGRRNCWLKSLSECLLSQRNSFTLKKLPFTGIFGCLVYYMERTNRIFITSSA